MEAVHTSDLPQYEEESDSGHVTVQTYKYE